MHTHQCHCTLPWGKKNEVGTLSASKQGLLREGTPEYSWFGANMEGWCMAQVVLILIDYLISSSPIITMKAHLFIQHPKKGFVVGYK